MTRRTRVYIAGPITSSGDLLHNIRRALDAGSALLARGYAPYIPHLTCYWEIVANGEFSYEDWMSLDIEYLRTCDALLRLEGVSKGADREMAWAKAHGMPVYYSLDLLVACEKATR